MADSRGAGGPLAGAVDRIRHLIPELAKFGVVGAIGAVVDLGGSAFLYGTMHVGPLTAKAMAITAACVVTYLGSRFWTFRHRENQPLARELGLFIVLNVVGLVIAEAVIALTAYAFGNKDQLAYNLASVAGTGLGTIFRYFAYRKWVFLVPGQSALSLQPFATPGTSASPSRPRTAPGDGYPPWAIVTTPNAVLNASGGQDGTGGQNGIEASPGSLMARPHGTPPGAPPPAEVPAARPAGRHRKPR